MDAGTLDITQSNINEEVSTKLTYVGDTDRVATHEKKWVDATNGKTHTWTKNHTYDSKNRLIGVSEWIHKVVNTSSLSDDSYEGRN